MNWGNSLTDFMRRQEEDERKKKAPDDESVNLLRQKPAPVAPEKLPEELTRRDGVAAALAELDGLIGLEKVKTEIRDTIDMLELTRERARKRMPGMNPAGHLVFTGNPGTGKTTVARIVARIYKEIGLLKSGHLVEVEKADLIAGFIGQTAPKTKDVIAQAMDGVLFIDEAYTLKATGKANDFEGEAVAALVKGMEDNRDRLVVIAAGYKDEMQGFIDSNPGLKSRFEMFIEFEDYSGEELLKIFLHMGREAGVRPSFDAQIAVANLMESLETGTKGFGNGRTVRNIFRDCLKRQARRLREKGRRQVDVTVFEADDIPKVGEKVFS
jgi:SpoVK/Ycf46/Vps4 family AAA+-type ATPase